jgi:hypothetical protein
MTQVIRINVTNRKGNRATNPFRHVSSTAKDLIIDQEYFLSKVHKIDFGCRIFSSSGALH